MAEEIDVETVRDHHPRDHYEEGHFTNPARQASGHQAEYGGHDYQNEANDVFCLHSNPVIAPPLRA
jgi:hypothetical protein